MCTFRTPTPKKGRYNLTNLTSLTPRLAAEQVSNKAAARLLTKYNEVIGIEDRVTEKKVRGMRARTKKQLLDDLKGLTVKSLYFDGRKDNGNYHRLQRKIF